jgi:hypothetical protein
MYTHHISFFHCLLWSFLYGILTAYLWLDMAHERKLWFCSSVKMWLYIDYPFAFGPLLKSPGRDADLGAPSFSLVSEFLASDNDSIYEPLIMII